MSKVDDALARLALASAAELKTEWQVLFSEEPPPLPTSLLRRTLAYRLQEQAYGGLPAGARKTLETLARDPEAKPVQPTIRLKPGTRLMREWNGHMHAVLVTEDGLLLDGQRYASLSQVARAITGAHWSGPRFFGLKRPVNPPSRSGTRKSEAARG